MYNQALKFQLNAIKYLKRRQKKQKVLFENAVEMKDVLAAIYVKQKKT